MAMITHPLGPHTCPHTHPHSWALLRTSRPSSRADRCVSVNNSADVLRVMLSSGRLEAATDGYAEGKIIWRAAPAISASSRSFPGGAGRAGGHEHAGDQ